MQGIFSGRIIDVHNDKVMLVDGDIADREVVDHPGGVGIIGLTDENEILLVRQFRYPYKETIYEIPAGKLERVRTLAKQASGNFLRNAAQRRRCLNHSARFIRHRAIAAK